MSPTRIQLRRTRGWRKPEGAIVVARPSKWGNPFEVGSDVTVSGVQYDGLIFDGVRLVVTQAMAVEMYRDLATGRIDTYGSTDPEDLAYVAGWRDGLKQIAGHDLACWCPLDQPCHADVLLELTNGANA